MYSNCQSSVSSSQVFTETLYKYSNINFQIAAFLSIFVFYHKPYCVFVYILKIDSQYVFTIYSTYNVFEFVSTSNTNCLLGFPSNSVQGSMLTSFTSQRLKHLEEQSKFSFLTVTVLQADQKMPSLKLNWGGMKIERSSVKWVTFSWFPGWFRSIEQKLFWEKKNHSDSTFHQYNSLVCPFIVFTMDYY